MSYECGCVECRERRTGEACAVAHFYSLLGLLTGGGLALFVAKLLEAL